MQHLLKLTDKEAHQAVTVRVLVRQPDSPAAQALKAKGGQLVQGSMELSIGVH